MRALRIQPRMESPIRPPEMRKGYASSTLVFIIVGVIVAAILMFVVFGPR